ncbi:hypothetical protein ACJX0J_017231, partial [Zea mays]
MIVLCSTYVVVGLGFAPDLLFLNFIHEYLLIQLMNIHIFDIVLYLKILFLSLTRTH